MSSLPMPSHYGSKFDWAADFVRDHGMTLPPDTPELRSLRNWFCFKLNQFKKGTLGESNIAQLARYGLDFSRYEATNTGKGHRSPDADLIDALRAWHQLTGGYDLSNSSPDELIEFQRLLQDTFSVRGYTERARKIEASLEDFRIPLWRHAGQDPVDAEEARWWKMADYYVTSTKKTPAYLGVVHPEAEALAADWAVEQIGRAPRLTRMQRGFMRGQGLMIDTTMRRVNKRREADRQVRAGVSLDQPIYGLKDRRLDSFLGICMYFRMLLTSSSDKEIMSAFGIDPEGLLFLRKNVDPICQGFTVNTMTDVRKLYPQFGEQLLTYDHPGCLETRDSARPAMLRPIHIDVLRAIKQALSFSRAHFIRQDIAIY
ncbi:hypothetical protein [Hydrogenophaga sp. 2FB]|uniref:hypothetical protein n=1 Tax=Hydrogenophaga sp. 2FB TaxID=2502187 RepID=UPI0010F72309|nr:hypothetical protein [Hydrogenophaga sp. 2FB]